MRGILALALLTGCGTYSMMRPADTLPAKHAEVAAGVATSQLGEANTILHAAYGITDRFEVLAQNEVWNSFVEVRYGILKTRPNGLALAVGLGAGRAVTFLSAVTSSGDHEHYDGAAGTGSVAVGRDFGRVALTLGNRTFLFNGYLASSTRFGMRVLVAGPFGFELEAGATVHTPLGSGVALTIGEGSGAFFLTF